MITRRSAVIDVLMTLGGIGAATRGDSERALSRKGLRACGGVAVAISGCSSPDRDADMSAMPQRPVGTYGLREDATAQLRARLFVPDSP